MSVPTMSVPLLEPSPFITPTVTVDRFKLQLIQLLDIPADLTGPGDVSLKIAYKKYKAFLIAHSTFRSMVANGTWEIKRPTKTDLIEIFVSKLFFHSHYQ